MILAVVGAAAAASCCSGAGLRPASLASCDALAVDVGTHGRIETGGWASSGRWFPAGDDGGGSAQVGVSILGRLAPWLTVGGRLPLGLVGERVDGVVDLQPGLGDALVWAGVESAWEGPMSLGLDLGATAWSDDEELPVALAVSGRVAVDLGAWRVFGALGARHRVVGLAPPELDAGIDTDRSLGGRLRLGGGVTVETAWGGIPGYSVLVGPSLAWAGDADQVVFSVRGGVPVDHLGRADVSVVTAAVDWYHVLRRTSP